MAEPRYHDIITEEPDRAINVAYDINSDIKDYDDFKNALMDEKKGFGNPIRGQNAKITEEDIAILWHREENKRKLRQNVFEDFENEERKELREENLRLKKEKKLTETQIKNLAKEKAEERFEEMFLKEKELKEMGFAKIIERKPIIITPTFRIEQHSKKGKTYKRTFVEWSPVKRRFVAERVKKKIRPKQILEQYNRKYKDNPRTLSSISTESSRLRKSHYKIN